MTSDTSDDKPCCPICHSTNPAYMNALEAYRTDPSMDQSEVSCPSSFHQRSDTSDELAAEARRLLDAYPEDVFPPLPDGWEPADEFDGWVDDETAVSVTPDAFAAHVLRKIALPVIAALLAERDAERAARERAEAERDEAERRERTAVNLANYHRGVAREAGRRADAARPPAPTESTPDPPYQPVAGRPTMDLLDRGTDR